MINFEIKNFSHLTTSRDVAKLMSIKKNKKIDPNFYVSKYDISNYANHEMMSKLVYHNGKAVAHVGVFPMKALINGKIHKIIQIGDIINHPDYSGKGLLTSLLNSVTEEAIKNNFSFLFVVTNENVLPIFKHFIQ